MAMSCRVEESKFLGIVIDQHGRTTSNMSPKR